MMKTYIFIKYLLFFLFLNLHFISDVYSQDTLDYNFVEKDIESYSSQKKVNYYLSVFSELVDKDLLKAIIYNQKAYETALKNNFSDELAYCYYNFGVIDRINANHLQGIENFKKSMVYFGKNDNKKGLSQSYNNIGIIYKNMHELMLSLEYYFKALKMAEEISYTDGIVDAVSNIAVIYLTQENYKLAVEYLEKSYALQKNEEDQHIILNNLGIANEKMGKHIEALKYYTKSLDICLKNSEYKCQAKPLSNMGSIYLFQGDYEKALSSFSKAQEIEEKFNLKSDLIATYTNIALVYKMQKKYETALGYFNKAVTIAEQTSENSVLLKIYLGISLTYEEYEKYVLALDYLYKYIALNKELYNLEKNKQIQELLAKFETENKEKEISILKKEQELKDIELKRNKSELETQILFNELEKKKTETGILLLTKQNELQLLHLEKNEIENEKKKKEIKYLTKEAELQNIKYEKRKAELKQKNILKNIAFIGAGFIFISALVLIVVYQQKLKTVELLNVKTEEVNKQKIYELLRDQEFSAIMAGIEGQEKERLRIAQDLHDGIGGNLASIKMNIANIIKDNKNERLLKLKKNIDDTYNEVRTISHNLIPAKIYDEAFIKLIQNFINGILQLENLKIKFTAFPEKDVNLLRNEIKIELYRIIQELLNNIIKYSKAKNVDIQLIKRDDQINLMVEDDGIGFDINKHTQGIGLNNIRSRIRALKGDVNIESSIGNWTLVNIEIPVDIN